MSKGSERSLLEVCVAAAGGDVKAIRKGAQVCEFILEWTYATKALGHDPGIDEFGKWWKHSDKEQRTAWLRLKEFRQLFPDEKTPARFADLIIEAKENRELDALVRLAV